MMASHLFRSITTSLIVLAAAPFTFAADPAPDASAMDKARMDAAIQFAETVLKHARDVYGEKHTPLFCDALDVDTMKAPEMSYLSRLGGPGPRQGRPYQLRDFQQPRLPGQSDTVYGRSESVHRGAKIQREEVRRFSLRVYRNTLRQMRTSLGIV